MITPSHSLAIIIVCALVTLLTRALPFLAFKKKTPKVVLYLGSVLPYAIMGMLVVYCLKNVRPLEGSHGLPEFISVLFVILFYKWKHNTLLSILFGTILYMVLIRTVF